MGLLWHFRHQTPSALRQSDVNLIGAEQPLQALGVVTRGRFSIGLFKAYQAIQGLPLPGGLFRYEPATKIHR